MIFLMQYFPFEFSSLKFKLIYLLSSHLVEFNRKNIQLLQSSLESMLNFIYKNADLDIFSYV